MYFKKMFAHVRRSFLITIEPVQKLDPVISSYFLEHHISGDTLATYQLLLK